MKETAEAAAPFEGPEKLLELWFAQSPFDIQDTSTELSPGIKYGLRKVPKHVWKEMLAIVKCTILSVVEGFDMDVYLLSESSLFVSPHRLILKTCGTTLNLLGLPRILEIAREYAGLCTVYRCFYSRKSFFFPERQKGPHREWKDEVGFLDNIFKNGAAYTVGKVNGDHWLLYIINPPDGFLTNPSQKLLNPCDPPNDITLSYKHKKNLGMSGIDYTIEILMSHLSEKASRAFEFNELPDNAESTPSTRALATSSLIGISDLFPAKLTTLDAYAFTPCGYSANALIRWTEPIFPGASNTGEGYYTIHVTPERDYSYASFECNVPLPTRVTKSPQNIPDLKTLVRRVVNIFQPSKLSLTLFISSEQNDEVEDERGESAIEAAQCAFRAALTSNSNLGLNKHGNGYIEFGNSEEEEEGGYGQGKWSGMYKRTDKINYKFEDYDLAFASFELVE